jgi:hypothetical protein
MFFSAVQRLFKWLKARVNAELQRADAVPPYPYDDDEGADEWTEARARVKEAERRSGKKQ